MWCKICISIISIAITLDHVPTVYIILCRRRLYVRVTVRGRAVSCVGWIPTFFFPTLCYREQKISRLSMGDHLVLKSMKNIVICGNWCELWNFVSIVFLNENFSTDTFVSVLHLFQYIKSTIRIYFCCCGTLVLRRMQWYKFSQVTRVAASKNVNLTCIWNQVWRPAELKHINKRRKRNQMRFP